MSSPAKLNKADLLRTLPSVDRLMNTTTAERFEAEFGRTRMVSAARRVVDELREGILRSENASAFEADLLKTAEDHLAQALEEEKRSRLTKVINATGVIVHTNLGRAPLSDEAIEAIRNASGYCALEYDIDTAGRGRRGRYAEKLAAEITGAEEAAIVNNCAAAALLVLTALAEGGEAVISRGELVEIGGDFRVPDVMVRSGTKLVEVGTTNRTSLKDYENAITDDTSLLLKVHPSNYRIVGFSSVPSVRELAELAHSKGIILFEDAGSGALCDLTKYGLDDEPVISESITAGADVVTFSGDKLLGSVQSGFIVGKAEVLAKIRRHPLYRALRPSKVIYAALEVALETFLKGEQFEKVPVLRMLSEDEKSLEERTRAAAESISTSAEGFEGVSIEVVAGESVIGGGSAPHVHPKGWVLAISDENQGPEKIASWLRLNQPPIIGRIEEDRLVLDLRTVDERDIETLVGSVCEALSD